MTRLDAASPILATGFSRALHGRAPPLSFLRHPVDFRLLFARASLYCSTGMEKAPELRVVHGSGDPDLVARCVAGDRTAQRRLFENEKRRVHATLFRILGPNQSLDDLVQDVFLSVFRSLHSFRGESSISTWVDRCAVHAALAHMRARKTRQHLELVPELVASTDASAERQALVREATRHLYDTLAGLPSKQRTAFALSAIDGRSVEEVAELMGASAMATKARIWRARRHVEKRAKSDPVLAGYLRDAKDGSATARKGPVRS
jgi:RNA polymerase sigma-70 factor (ECF subfamily)